MPRRSADLAVNDASTLHAAAAAHLDAIVQSSDDAILSKNLEGTITSWNGAAERLYGYGATEAIGRSVAMLIVDPAEHEAILQSVVAGRAVAPYETRRRRRNGSLVEVAVSISPIFDGEGGVLGAATIARDISERKDAERALKLSEQRYRTLIARLPDAAVYEYDTKLRLLSAEGRLLARAGAVPERLIGQTIWEILPSERADEFADHCRAALQGAARRFEWETSTGDMILDVDIVPRGDREAITGVIVLVRDVSESRRNERDLNVQAQLLDRLEAAVVVTDDEGRVTQWNRHAEALYARPATRALGRSITQLGAEYGVPELTEILASLRDGGTLQAEYELHLPDGRTTPVLLATSAVHDASGDLVGYTGLGVDLTPSRRVAEELHGARGLFESSFENAPLGMALLAASGAGRGSVLRANSAFGEMLGRASAELVGSSLADLAHPDDAERLRRTIERLLAGDVSDARLEVQLQGAGARPVFANLCFSLIRGPEGAPLRAVALVQDTTREREDRAEKEALEARLHQSQKLDSIGQLAGGIAHDFNNLLAVIRTYADMAAEDIEDDDLRADVVQIRTAADRAAALTRQLLVFARRDVAQPRALDLNDVVAETQKLLRRTIGEHIDLRIDLEPDVPRVRADRGQMDQIVLNLAVNARDAMPDGGALVIRTQSLDLDRDSARRAGVDPGRYVRLAVADTGCGMSPAVAERVFEPFFTTKPRGEGTGLGLATVYAIATKAGGYVDFHTNRRAGTTFEVTLPASGADEPEDPEVAEQLPACGQGETVLLVEDDAAVRQLTGRLLQDADYRVLEAASGVEALRQADQAPVELLLTDVVMPGMPGTELARRLLAAHPGLRVVYMSGYTDDVVMRHGIQERRVAFIEKPFTRASLLAGVRMALDAEPEMERHGGP
jgi:PAS domain S-box-containing protein